MMTHSADVTYFWFVSPVGQGGEELPCVLWALSRYDWLGQAGALPARSWDLLLPKPSTLHISGQKFSLSLMFSFLHHHHFILPLFFFLEGGSCEPKGKQDKEDFQLLCQCFETIGLHADQISTVWAILSSILQLGNMCFSSYEVHDLEKEWTLLKIVKKKKASRISWTSSIQFIIAKVTYFQAFLFQFWWLWFMQLKWNILMFSNDLFNCFNWSSYSSKLMW